MKTKFKISNRILSLVLAFVMVLSMMPMTRFTAFAADSVSYLDATGKSCTTSSYTEITSSTTTLTSGWYVVKSNVLIDSRIAVSGDVHLILCDGATFEVSTGISVNSGNSLTIYGQADGTGTLESGTEYSCASIGGDNGYGAGNITINGGIINATSEVMWTPAIGGGYAGNGGTVTINGGTVTASGECGIGSGFQGSLDKITITGGIVTATGKDGAGIGSYGSNDTAAGLGKGYVSEILITGGVVNATGKYGAGIGGGHGSYGEWTITITGGTVNATCTVWGAGIGGGRGGNGKYSIAITGGTVTANGDSTYDIGGGNGPLGTAGTASVTITGGNVCADNVYSLNSVVITVGGASEGQKVDSITFSDSTYDYDLTDLVIADTNKIYLCLKDGVTVTAVTVAGVGYPFIRENMFCIHPEYHNATCLQTGTCTVCGTAGTKDPDNHENKQQYNYVINSKDDTKHDVIYSCCEKLKETVGHHYEDGVCKECGKICNHSFVAGGTCAICGEAENEYKYVYYEWNVTNKTLTSNIASFYPNKHIAADTTEWSAGWYVVSSDVTISDRVTVSGDVKLVLLDGFTLTATAGITVNEGNSLTIYAQTGDTGKLITNDNIGGNSGTSSGVVTIHGGTVTATGGLGSAGIGGGYGGTGGTITIYGGTVTATGGNHAAGIGGGSTGDGGEITIYDGMIKATGTSYGAGIGGGSSGDGGEITIYDGEVTATSEGDGAGIGGGNSGSGGKITISGGKVTAESKNAGAGIGGGRRGAGGEITISGGTVTAVSNTTSTDNLMSAAGIGGGARADGGTIVITGGNIKAVPCYGADAIGDGARSDSEGTLTDGTNAVSLQTLTLYGMTEQTAVSEITGVDNYGLNDVYTLDNNTLYFYLPSGAVVKTITAGGTEYICKSGSTYYANHDWSNKDGVCIRCGATCSHEGQTGTECGICGYISHSHQWTYTAENSTITATCTADGCSAPNGGSVTLVAEDAYYTGSAIAATASGSFTNGATYVITYNDGTETAPNGVGTHTATLTVFENGTEKESVSAEYKISYLTAPENAYSISGGYVDGDTYWFKDDATITVKAPEGYTISTTLNGTYGESVSFSENDSKVVISRELLTGQ